MNNVHIHETADIPPRGHNEQRTRTKPWILRCVSQHPPHPTHVHTSIIVAERDTSFLGTDGKIIRPQYAVLDGSSRAHLVNLKGSVGTSNKTTVGLHITLSLLAHVPCLCRGTGGTRLLGRNAKYIRRGHTSHTSSRKNCYYWIMGVGRCGVKISEFEDRTCK